MRMTKKKKKAGSTASYGAKYGVKAKKQVKLIKKQKQSRYVCPQCKAKRVKRLSAGIFQCLKCGYKFTGGAYQSSTAAGMSGKKLISKIVGGKE
jgi:large subunit ribosomal protein L37Ae